MMIRVDLHERLKNAALQRNMSLYGYMNKAVEAIVELEKLGIPPWEAKDLVWGIVVFNKAGGLPYDVQDTERGWGELGKRVARILNDYSQTKPGFPEVKKIFRFITAVLLGIKTTDEREKRVFAVSPSLSSEVKGRLSAFFDKLGSELNVKLQIDTTKENYFSIEVE
jgi:hypothetical protein